MAAHGATVDAGGDAWRPSWDCRLELKREWDFAHSATSLVARVLEKQAELRDLYNLASEVILC